MAKSIPGGVEIVNTLSTKNDGDYPLVKAESVGMNDGTTAEDSIKKKLDKNQGAQNNGKFMKVGADGNLVPENVPVPDVSGQINNHNTNGSAHTDIRELVAKLTDRLNTIANSDDVSLDQLSEIVAYIKNNKSLIEQVTTNKLNVADVVNNLTTNVTTKALSASMGVELKRLIDAIEIPDVAGQINTHNTSGTSHKDIRDEVAKKAGKSTTLSGYGITDGATKSELSGHNTNNSAHADIRTDVTTLKEAFTALDNMKADGIIETASGEDIKTEISSDSKLIGLKVFGKSEQSGVPSPQSPVPIVNVGDKGNVNAKIIGKNLLNLQCYSAKTMNSVEEEPTLTNAYGTEISTTEAVNKVVVEQKQIVDTKDHASYKNGFMVFAFRDDFVAEKTYNLSFNLEVLNNPLGAKEIAFLVNGSYLRKANIQKQVKTQFTYQKREARQFIELRCSGMDFVLSNIMITEADCDYNYEPYHDSQTITFATPNGLPGIKVENDGNYTDKDGNQWVCDEINSTERIQRIGRIKSYNNEPINTKYMSSTGELSVGADVIYALGKSIVTPLTEDEKLNFVKLHTNYPTTIISNDENAGMEISYVADTKGYIDKKFEELNQAIVNTQISLL